ncbi:hypothetical protein BsWGS_02426 [Bradybaena similaris]
MEMKLFAICFLFVSFCSLVCHAADGKDATTTERDSSNATVTTERDDSNSTVTTLSTVTTFSNVTTNTTTASHSSTTAQTTTKKNGSVMTLALPLLVNILPLFIILYVTRF